MRNKKVIFWAVDCQRDFMNPDGKLYIEGSESIKPNLKKLTEFAQQKNLMVINTADFHFPGDEELSDKPDFKTTFPNHCMWDSSGYRFIEETEIHGDYSIIDYRKGQETTLDVYDKNIVLTKNKFDVFEGNPHTNKLLDFLNPDVVVVYGVATNVCVNCAVLGLVKKGIKVVVVEDAIKGLPNLPIVEIFKDWISKGVEFMDLQKLFSFYLPSFACIGDKK